MICIFELKIQTADIESFGNPGSCSAAEAVPKSVVCQHFQKRIRKFCDIPFRNQYSRLPIENCLPDSGCVKADGGHTQGMCFHENSRLAFRVSIARCHTWHAKYTRLIQPVEDAIAWLRI